MALCEQCGSIRIVRARPQPLDRLVRLFTTKRPFLCRRCGWRGRQSWTEDDLAKLSSYGVGGAEPDPELVVLDGNRSHGGSRKRRRRSGPKAATASNAGWSQDFQLT